MPLFVNIYQHTLTFSAAVEFGFHDMQARHRCAVRLQRAAAIKKSRCATGQAGLKATKSPVYAGLQVQANRLAESEGFEPSMRFWHILP